MELLEFSSKSTWKKRNSWIKIEIDNAIKGSHDVSDHAVALFVDLQACYCIGAWISVVILSVSVIDAHLREVEAMNSTIGTAKLLDEYYNGSNIKWLRRLRNKYVHIDLENPALELNIQFDKRDELEKDATKAIKMVISALFRNGGT